MLMLMRGMEGGVYGSVLLGCRNCSNTRISGIVITGGELDVVGKLFGHILQGRLQLITEKVLPEFQCCFYKGRGCVDVAITARQ